MTIKKIIILAIGHFFSTAFGQEVVEEKNESNFNKFQIGINFSPDYCFRTLKNNDGSSESDIVLDLVNKIDVFKFGYTGGFNFCYNMNSFIGVESGVQYSNKGFQTVKQDVILQQPDPVVPNQIKYIYGFHYVDIPLKVNFTVGKKKIRFFSSVGVTTNFLITATQKNFWYFSDHTNKHINASSFGYKRVNISPTVSVGIDYKINNRMNLRVEPTLRYGVLKIIDSPVTGYLYNAGLNVSYYIGL